MNASHAPLPIDAVLPDIVAALQRANAVVIRAPTGAGKTTRVPPALIQLTVKPILVLEPRRLAARAAARRMAAEHGTPLGQVFGYHVRFDRKAGPHTRVIVVTPGIQIRYLHDDPFLNQTDLVIFDEFHERGLESDLALGMVKLIQATVRPELRIVVMSATLEAESVSAYLDKCPVVVSEGKTYPVEIIYEPRDGSRPWQADVTRIIGRRLRQCSGDLLVFLPGMGEIRRLARELEPLAQQLNLAVLPLHSDISAEQQDAALLPMPKRKVVLATNVAETSVTVEGITCVVDLGTARILEFDPTVGLDRLEIDPISKASADQRAGRAGRMQSGTCIRLWSESSHLGRASTTEPEIRRVDLAGAVLQLLALGEMDTEKFPWLDPPPPATIAQANKLLDTLGATESGRLTELGRLMVRLPVHPRLARLLIEGHRLGCTERAAAAAALLSERSPFDRSRGRANQARKHVTTSDILEAIESLEAFERGTSDPALNHSAARFVLRARDQLVRLMHDELGATQRNEDEKALRQALYSAFPDRLARRRNPGGARGIMIGGRGVKLAPDSGVTQAELFLCIDVEAGQAEAIVRQASAVDRDWLDATKLTTRIELSLDLQSERVVARKRTVFEDLVLEDAPSHLPDDATVSKLLIEAAHDHWARIRPADDSAAGKYLVRVRCLRDWMPELQLPEFDDDELRELLNWVEPSARSFADLRNADWLAAIQGRLSHEQRLAVERASPERLPVPSGSTHELHYERGRSPVLAVRIQELFGLRETPCVAHGRVKVLLHLLAPNYRPQQVTDDLASFWTNTYPQVRKDLRGRYPKHAWPEDPLTALPEQRPRKKTGN